MVIVVLTSTTWGVCDGGWCMFGIADAWEGILVKQAHVFRHFSSLLHSCAESENVVLWVLKALCNLSVEGEILEDLLFLRCFRCFPPSSCFLTPYVSQCVCRSQWAALPGRQLGAANCCMLPINIPTLRLSHLCHCHDSTRKPVHESAAATTLSHFC